MSIDKRSFLKVAGLAALSAAAPRKGRGVTPEQVSANAGALSATRWAMVINPKKCPEGCTACTDACHLVHNVPDIAGSPEGNPNHEIKWIWQEGFAHAFPSKEHHHVQKSIRELPIPVLCNHCDNPPCVRVCPTQATWKRKNDGIVMMDMHRCIGCRFCMAACPFGSRSFNYRDPRSFIEEVYKGYPTRTKGVVEKCTFCAERLAVGKMPACVEACREACKARNPLEAALVFGDLDDPGSDVSKLLEKHFTIRRKPELGTMPMVYYIVS